MKGQLTALSAARISELLEATTNLLGSTSLASLFENPVRDEAVPHGKPAKETRLS